MEFNKMKKAVRSTYLMIRNQKIIHSIKKLWTVSIPLSIRYDFHHQVTNVPLENPNYQKILIKNFEKGSVSNVYQH